MNVLLPILVLGILVAALARRRSDDPMPAEASSSSSGILAGAGALLEHYTGGMVSTGWQLPPRGELYAEAIRAAELAYGLPPNLWARQLDVESDHFAPDVINGTRPSSAGALGIAQMMPATAAERGIDPLDPFAAIDSGAAYMAELYQRFGDWASALVAYNWGLGNVQRKGLAAAPAESRTYANLILRDSQAWG